MRRRMMMARAFSGFQALPPPKHWSVILEIRTPASEEDIKAAFRKKAMTLHPDHGGSVAAFAELSAAKDQALKELSY